MKSNNFIGGRSYKVFLLRDQSNWKGSTSSLKSAIWIIIDLSDQTVCRFSLTLSSSGSVTDRSWSQSMNLLIAQDELMRHDQCEICCARGRQAARITVKGSAVRSRSVPIVPKIAYSGRVSCKSNKANKYCQNCSVLSALCVRGSHGITGTGCWSKEQKVKGKKVQEIVSEASCVRCAQLERVRHNMTWLFGPCRRLLDLAAASHSKPNSIGSRRSRTRNRISVPVFALMSSSQGDLPSSFSSFFSHLNLNVFKFRYLCRPHRTLSLSLSLSTVRLPNIEFCRSSTCVSSSVCVCV